MKKGDLIICITDSPDYGAYCKRGDLGRAIIVESDGAIFANWKLIGTYYQWVGQKDVAPATIWRFMREFIKRLFVRYELF